MLFWVKDTGSGIAAEHLPHVFDRFWQAKTAERRGAGLGLPIVKGIVEAHGGRIWVESTLGHGSTFFFTIPTAVPDEKKPGKYFGLNSNAYSSPSRMPSLSRSRAMRSPEPGGTAVKVSGVSVVSARS